VVVVFFIWQRITAVVVPVDHLYSEIHRVAAIDLPPWSNYCNKKIQEKYVYREPYLSTCIVKQSSSILWLPVHTSAE
jgi:hypothetical protein